MKAVRIARSRVGATFFVLASASLIYPLLQTLFIPTLPSIERSLHVSTTAATWLLSSFFLSSAVTTPIVGRLGDMYGKGRAFAGVLALTGVGGLVGALASSLGPLIVGRALEGISAALYPLAYGIVRDEFPRHRIPTGIGLISATVGLGLAMGTLLGGPIVDDLSYHWLSWLPLIMCIPLGIATIFTVPQSPIRAREGVDWIGALLLTGWLLAILFAASESASWGWGSARILGLLGTSVVLFIAWYRVELRVDNPLVDIRLMRDRTVFATNMCGFTFGLGLFAVFVLLAKFVATPRFTGYGFGASVTAAGLFLIPANLSMLTAASFMGRLAKRFGSKAVLISGALIAVVGFAWLATLPTARWNYYVASGLLGIGQGLCVASMSNIIVSAVPQSQTGIAAGMNSIARSSSGAIGAALAVAIISGRLSPSGYPVESGYRVAFVVLGVSLVLTAIFGAWIPSREARARTREALLAEGLGAGSDALTSSGTR